MRKEGKYIILDENAGLPPVEYTSSQEFLLPYVDTIETLWTICFWATVLVLVVRFVLIPVLHKAKITEDNPTA